MFDMADIESILQVVFASNMLLLILLVILVMSVLVAVVVCIMRMRTWPSYEAWVVRKRRLVSRYTDRTMLHAGESLSLYRKFRMSWDKQPVWVKFWWMITGVA